MQIEGTHNYSIAIQSGLDLIHITYHIMNCVRDVIQLRNAHFAMCVFIHNWAFSDLNVNLGQELQAICGALCRISHHHEGVNLHN